MPSVAQPLTAQDTRWMSRAIQLAAQGRYTARPNPCVGCVLVNDQGKKVGEGSHYRAGEAHAEVNALHQAGENARGATAYVTLEPCNHRGKTGPCTQALINAGIGRVIYGMTDPNPLVAGKGLARLAAAGVTVDGPLLETQCRELNPGFIARMEHKRPWVRGKLASSLDGRTAMASGESQWITGPAARADVQLWRARSCAIVTGIDSVLQDDSRLTLRESELRLNNAADVMKRPPLRVVLDSQLRIPLSAAVLQGEAKTLVWTTAEAARAQAQKCEQLNALEGVSVVVGEADNGGRVDLMALLQSLAADYECNTVLVETGARLMGAFWQQNLLDELVLYQAPVLLGSSARPLVDLPLTTMATKSELTIIDRRQLGPDQRIIARPNKT